MIATRKKIHLACETLDFTWDESQLAEARRLWDEGYTLRQLSSYFKRPMKETYILLADIMTPKEFAIFAGRLRQS